MEWIRACLEQVRGLFRPTPAPVTPTAIDRIINFVMENGRGVFGTIPILVLLIFVLAHTDDLINKPEKVVGLIYLMMFFCLLIHPIRVPIVAYIPVFTFPLFHVIDSNITARSYLCANTLLMVIGGYLHQMLNVSGWDKRCAMKIIYGKDKPQSTTRLLINSSIAAYILSMICSRQHTGPYIMELVVGTMRGGPHAGKDEIASPEKSMQAVMALAISSSASIGSLTMIISARNLMFMRSLWEMSGHQDTFNFLDYFLFAFPTTLTMFILNLMYNVMLVKIAVGKDMTEAEWIQYEQAVSVYKKDIPKKITTHEIQTLFFTFTTFILYFTRWSYLLGNITSWKGWASGVLDAQGNPKIPDVSIAAIMMIICCIIPHTFNFAKIFTAQRRRDLPPAKPDSAIILWKFVDKSTNYGYMFLVGGFCVLDLGIRRTKFGEEYLFDSLSSITTQSRPISILIWCAAGCVLSNIMTSVGAAGMLTILTLNCYRPDSEHFKYHYQFILASGMASGIGFLTRFKHTAMHHVATIAKVSFFTQLKYNCGSVIICLLVMWFAIYQHAPLIFDDWD